MKFTAIILLSAFLTASARGDAQVTLRERDASLPAVFSAIKKQTGYDFVYRMELVRQAGKISVNLRNVTLEQALDQCLKGTALTYVIIENTVVIRARENSGEPAEETKTLAPPPIDISGKVTDADGNPLIGASVTVKGKQIGTTTDAGGVFVLKGLSAEDEIIITYTGFQTKTYKVGTRTSFLVSLELDEKNLQEVVINKGYYTEKQSLTAGNVGVLKSKDIQKQPVQNPLLALQGRIPGLTVVQTTGLPGSNVQVRIQGENSLSSGNEPFYVIDGIPFLQYLPTSLSNIQGTAIANANAGLLSAVSPLNFINPNDIESIEVLKDADATAIYGSRAGNGAILITTKKGKAGKTEIGINIQRGWAKVNHFVDLLNTEEYLMMRQEAKKNDGANINPGDYDINGTWDQSRSTDWQKVLIGGTAQYDDASLSFSGGNEFTNFMVRAGFNRITTVFPGDLSDQKKSVLFNLGHKSSNRKMNFQLTANYLSDNNKLVSQDYTQIALQLPPNAPELYKTDGSINWAPNNNGSSTWYNPIAGLQNRFDQEVDNLLSNILLSYEVFKKVEIKVNLGYNKLWRTEFLLNPLSALAPEIRPAANRSTRFGESSYSSWIFEPQLTYNADILKGKVQLLIGTTLTENLSRNEQMLAYGFNSDQLMKTITAAPNLDPLASDNVEYRYGAIFGRVNFNWFDKYIVNFTGRRDGSSRFGSHNLFNNFFAIAGSWLFSNENFIRKAFSFISHGKIRLSYGTTGNDQIGDYRFMNTYYSTTPTVPYQGQSGLFAFDISNPYLQWEETTKLQGGLELGVFKNVFVNAGFYLNRSSNQLQNYSLPIMTGVSSVLTNFPATVQNSGLEFLGKVDLFKRKNIIWSFSINLTLPRNKLIRYDNLEGSSAATRLIIDKPISVMQLYNSVGVNSENGLYEFLAANGDTLNRPSFFTDRTIVFDNISKYYGGFQNQLSYKGIVLDFLIQFVNRNGGDYRYGDLPGRFSSGNNTIPSGNQPRTILERWQKVGDNSTYQRYSSTYPTSVRTPYTRFINSNSIVRNYSFVRLKNLAFSWQMPSKMLKNSYVKTFRCYLQGQNLWTKSDYIGLDPESGSSSLPPLKIWTIGLQITL